MDQYGLFVYIGGGVLLLVIIVVVVMLMKKGKGDEDEGKSRQRKTKKGGKKGRGPDKVPARGLWFFAMVSFFTLGIFIAVLVLQYKEWQHYMLPGHPQVEDQPRSAWPKDSQGLPNRYKTIW